MMMTIFGQPQTKKNVTHVTVESPCDLYGMNARMLHDAISCTDGVLYIEKPDEQRVCRADSLLGLLGLGVRKGDVIRFIAQEEASFSRIFSALQNAG